MTPAKHLKTGDAGPPSYAEVYALWDNSGRSQYVESLKDGWIYMTVRPSGSIEFVLKASGKSSTEPDALWVEGDPAQIGVGAGEESRPKDGYMHDMATAQSSLPVARRKRKLRQDPV